jgi:hypothetical protein
MDRYYFLDHMHEFVGTLHLMKLEGSNELTR